MREVDIAVIGGDGIGPDVTAEAMKVLQAAAPAEDLSFLFTEYALGAEHWLATGEVLSEDTLEKLRTHEAILFGAVGADPLDTRVPSGILERELLLKLRFAFDHCINLRPAHTVPGVATPLQGAPEIDFIVVREGTEGPYVGNGGSIRPGTAQEIATEVSINTAYGVERVVRDSFTRAMARRRQLTLVHKHNVLRHAGDLWRRSVEKVAAEFPEVSWDYMHVDAATIHMVSSPERFDVIVTDNLFGDILTDLAGAVTGGIGFAPSGSINPAKTAPSMFEPVHGSAPDIAGKNLADPTAAILSAALLARHLGFTRCAGVIEQAVDQNLRLWAAQPEQAVTGTTERGQAHAQKVAQLLATSS